jgi:hypothetical protein
VRWESRLFGYKEAPHCIDPIVFKYPARSTSAILLSVGCAFFIAGWFFADANSFGLALFVVPLIGVIGLCLTCLALWNLLAVRRIEIHRSARKIVEVKRMPIRRSPDRVHDFSDIRRISVTRGVGEETGTVSDVIVVELRNGDHVDFGNYSGDKGSLLAARLHELTGARVESAS